MPTNISTDYLGLQLNSPLIVGTCPLKMSPEHVRKLASAGAGAVALPSLFEEQVVSAMLERGALASEQESHFATMYSEAFDAEFSRLPEAYMQAIQDLNELGCELPIIASLNGCTNGRWLAIAAELQAAGADALEVTLEPELTSAELTADEVEQTMLDCVSELSDVASLPITVKLSPFHTSLPNRTWRLAEVGAVGITCFAHEPKWDVHLNRIETTADWPLTPAGYINQTISGLMRMRSGGPSIYLAANGGIGSIDDIRKVVLAGADAVMLTSEYYRSGPNVITQLCQGLHHLLDNYGVSSFEELKQSRPIPKPSLRSEYLKCLQRVERGEHAPYVVPHQTGDRWGHLI